MKIGDAIIIFTLLLLSSIPFTRDAGSTSMMKLSLEDMVDYSTLIITGKVKDVSYDWEFDHESGPVMTFVEVEVEELLKGKYRGSRVVLKELGGRIDDHPAFIPLGPRFAEGEKVFLFLEESRYGHLRCVGLFQGKFNIIKEPETGDEVMVRGIIPTWVVDYSPSMLKVPKDRVLFKDFKMKVQRLIEGEAK